ncbi:protein timeless homolog [Amphiura filiformis]|uniref:protein timeless homolog n=1 Tax=Amphiura filiformis TaxID=82378 RepID=UPI003B218EA9
MEFGSVVRVMNHELLATCNALGYLEGDTYQKEPDALETVKDLIRFLRREDDTVEIRRQLGNAQILQNDLIYLLKQFHKETELFETCTRLLVNLTQPAELCFDNKVPTDKTTRNYYLEVLSHLQAYKQAFADEELMVVLAKKLKKLLDMEWESRREDHTILMERILLLVRNVLHVPADPTQEKRTDDDASVHDQVLWALNVSGMDKLILYVASSEEEQQWCMHAIEITSLMLREQTPEQLAKAGITRASSEKQKDEQELEMARQREIAEKKARVLKGSGRHSRFGGTFYVKNFKSISERDVIYHQAPQKAKHISFDREKNPKKRAKNRMPMKDTSLTRRSTLSIRLFLREFCELFLDNCYNPLMHAVKDHILHQKAQENDDTYYLWAMRFFMEFSRHYHFRVDVISETFSVQAFYYVQVNLIKYMDMMVTDKKESAVWSKRMHYALKAYRELLATLETMTRSKDSKIRESARVTQSNIFYVIEYKELFVMLLKKFDDVRCTKSFLIDLIETTHIFLKMLENYCNGKNKILVQKKGKKKKKRRRRNQGANQQPPQGPSEEELNDGWDHVTSDLSAMLQGREDIPENVVPFDAASEQPVEEQRADAMVRIQRGLHNGQAGDAIALLRAAREVWPDGDIFGASDVSPEDEFMALREIHFTNLNVAPPPMEEPEMDMEEDEEDEMAEMERDVRGEEEFNFKGYILKFGHPDVIRCYVSALQTYRTNKVFTNHCAVKMLHRISFDQGDAPLLYQLSLFRVFQNLLNDPVSKLAQYKELTKFAKFVVGKFFEAATKNKKMFVEILFWKSRQDLYELEEGYGSVRPDVKMGHHWNEEEVDELKQLHAEHKDKLDPDAEEDIVDKIMEHILDDTRTRKQIINQLVELGLAESVADFKRKKPGWRTNLWREEQELELKILYDRYKDSDDPLGDIVENMSSKRTKVKVSDKLLSLGVVEERSQLYKKRRKKEGSGEGKRRKRKNYDDEEDEDEENEDDRDFIERGGEEEEDRDFAAEDDSDDSRGNANSEPEAEESESSDQDGEEGGDDMDMSLISVVAKLTKKGFGEQIKWIQGGLRSTANDREADGDDQAIPLVPLTEENENAMSNKLFKKFLKKVGLAPPSSHEEMFWRIPGTLDPQELRSAADSIEQTKEQKLEVAAEREKKKMENPRYLS